MILDDHFTYTSLISLLSILFPTSDFYIGQRYLVYRWTRVKRLSSAITRFVRHSIVSVPWMITIPKWGLMWWWLARWSLSYLIRLALCRPWGYDLNIRLNTPMAIARAYGQDFGKIYKHSVRRGSAEPLQLLTFHPATTKHSREHGFGYDSNSERAWIDGIEALRIPL